MAGEAVRVHYYEGDVLRFLKGKLIEETEGFITVEMHHYIVTIAKKQVAKIETQKNRRAQW